ncbi:MAG TPA: anthrone oxygenase family protein [Candidatus Udaeobacter sp.]|nr:anthrone oxygenase family protein [Candidatus Udaeobacter sp.]
MERTTTWKVTTFVGLFLLALVTGVFWGTWFTLTRSIETFSAGEFIHIGQTIIRNVAWPMRILMPACILSMIVSASLVAQKNSLRFYLSVAACLLIVIALLITLLVEVPIDNQIRTWSAETLPANWMALRERWQIFHTARTLVSLASLASLILALLSSRQKT